MRSMIKRSACFAAAGMLALSGIAIIKAEESAPEIQYETNVTSSGPYTSNVEITIRIPKGVTASTLPIRAFSNMEDELFFMPGSTIPYQINIVNESGIEYSYSENSLNMTPEVPDPENEWFRVNRTFNNALKDLELSKSDISDETVGEKLLAKGYGEGENLSAEEITVKYLDDYYTAYYNSKTGDTLKSLNEVPTDYVPQFFTGQKSGDKESNEEANSLGLRYAYDSILTIDGTGVSKYHAGEAAYAEMETSIISCVAEQETISFSLHADIEKMNNAYASTSFSFPFDFTLVQQDVTPDKKIGKPDLEKKITDGDKIKIDESGDTATIDASGKIKYQLTSHIGEDLADVIVPKKAVEPSTAPGELPLDQFDLGEYSFAFVDYLDEELVLDSESFELTVNGQPVEVTADVQKVESGTYEGRTEIKVSVDLIDLFAKNVFSYSGIGTAPIVLTYLAGTKNGSEITPGKMFNNAWVEYQDSKTKEDLVDTDTFGLKIHKYDQTTNKGLQGAVFELIYINEEGKETVAATNLVSDIQGNVIVKGLKAGNYQLKEAKAPAGYNKSDAPLKIIVDADHDDDHYYVETHFANVPEVHTGGAGTTMFTIGGGLLILAGGVYLIISKKRSDE